MRGAEGDRMKGAIARTAGPAWKVDGDWRTLERRGDTGLNERPLLARELSCDTVEVESGEGESGPAVLQGSRRATAAVTTACLPGWRELPTVLTVPLRGPGFPSVCFSYELLFGHFRLGILKT